MNQSLRAALAQGKTEAVIAELLERSTHDDDLHNQVVALSARYAQYEKQYLGNLEEASVLNIELNKINAAVLDIIDQLDPAPAVVPRSRPWVKVLTIATIFAVLGAIFMFSGFSLRDLFGKKALPVSTQTPAPAPQHDTNTAPAPVSPANSTFERKPVPGSSEQGQNSMIVTCKTNKGRGNLYFKSGEYMRFYAKVGQPCFLRCIYRMADGRLMLLDADRQLNTEAVDQWLVVGPLFQAAEPYGEEEMYVFAQEGAFEPLKTRSDPDGYIFITETLEDALRKSRSLRKKYRLNESGLRLKTVL
jgi:hypothetical protein